MRDPNRLYELYFKIAELHKDKVPDCRIGQLMYNFILKMGDPFYWEDEMFVEKLKEYLEEIVNA